MELCSIASGSSGNCIYIGGADTRLLVDTGISKIRIENGLRSIHVDPESLDAILITHDHSDHIKGLGVFSRKYRIPIFGTKEALAQVRSNNCLGPIPEELFHVIRPDEAFYLGDMKVDPIKTSHDAAGSVAYRFEDDHSAMAVITDLGNYDAYIVEKLKELDAILIEANHDVCMLEVGSYPYPLKRRILSDWGHLSNELCGRLLCSIVTERMQQVILGHLSKENNMPELAYETVKLELRYGLGDMVADSLPIVVASREEVTPPVRV